MTKFFAWQIFAFVENEITNKLNKSLGILIETFFFLSVRKYVYCKRGAKEATQIDTEKNNSPPYKRTQTTKRAKKKNPLP